MCVCVCVGTEIYNRVVHVCVCQNYRYCVPHCVCVCVCVCKCNYLMYSVVMSKGKAVCCELRTGSHNDMETPHVQRVVSYYM